MRSWDVNDQTDVTLRVFSACMLALTSCYRLSLSTWWWPCCSAYVASGRRKRQSVKVYWSDVAWDFCCFFFFMVMCLYINYLCIVQAKCMGGEPEHLWTVLLPMTVKCFVSVAVFRTIDPLLITTACSLVSYCIIIYFIWSTDYYDVFFLYI